MQQPIICMILVESSRGLFEAAGRVPQRDQHHANNWEPEGLCNRGALAFGSVGVPFAGILWAGKEVQAKKMNSSSGNLDLKTSSIC